MLRELDVDDLDIFSDCLEPNGTCNQKLEEVLLLTENGDIDRSVEFYLTLTPPSCQAVSFGKSVTYFVKEFQQRA